MSLTRIWCLKTRSQDATLAVFVDETIYGTPEVNRNQEAHYILIAKMDENQQLTFLPGVINTTPLTTLEYPFTQSVDGAYRLIEFNPAFYDNAAHYNQEVKSGTTVTTYANIIWHGASNAFYKAINHTDFVGIEPSVTTGWADYWQVCTEEIFQANISSDKAGIVVHDDIITFRYEECLIEELDEVNDDILCGVCAKWEDMFETLAMQLLLDGANSKNWQDKQPQAEIIISAATKQFCC
jgi:hypothetical protein